MERANVMGVDKKVFIKCFMVPPEFVIQTAYDIRSAFEAYCDGDVQRSRLLLAKADDPKLTKYQEDVNRIKLERAAIFMKMATVIKKPKVETRMPKESEKVKIFTRDGWHCRFCGNPVIYKDVVKHFSKLEIGARWGRTNNDKHRGISPFFAVADHLIVHSKGGDNSPDNIVTACGPCNYGSTRLVVEC